MLSRVAENIYWMARYIERAENSARIINVNTNLLLDLPIKVTLGWEPLIEITANKALFKELYPEGTERNIVKFLVADQRNQGSLLSSLHHARENARTIRDIIPRDGWESINNLYHNTKVGVAANLSQNKRHDFLHGVIAGSQQITGLLAGTMLNDQGYQFLRLGRNLERADMTTRIVDVRSVNLLPEEDEELKPFEHIQWTSVLQSLSAFQAYLQNVQGPVKHNLVLAFLLQSRQFPRAFVHCISEVQECLKKLPRDTEALMMSSQIIEKVKKTRTASLTKKNLHKYLDDLQLQVLKLGTTIQNTFFNLQ